MIDPTPFWDFDDPAASEQRLREVADREVPPTRDSWLTQVARALGLQERYAEAHTLLDDLDLDDPEVEVRCTLERGVIV